MSHKSRARNVNLSVDEERAHTYTHTYIKGILMLRRTYEIAFTCKNKTRMKTEENGGHFRCSKNGFFERRKLQNAQKLILYFMAGLCRTPFIEVL